MPNGPTKCFCAAFRAVQAASGEIKDGAWKEDRSFVKRNKQSTDHRKCNGEVGPQLVVSVLVAASIRVLDDATPVMAFLLEEFKREIVTC